MVSSKLFLIAVSLCACRRSIEEYSGCDSMGYGMTAGVSSYVLFELRGLSNFFQKPYSSIDAMKLSKQSTRTTPAS